MLYSMDMDKQLTPWTSSSLVVKVDTAETLAQIRLDPVKYPHYKDIAQGARIKWVAGHAFSFAEILRLRDFDVDASVLLATALDEMIMEDTYMADLTLPEIRDALKDGVFGNYGEFHGLTAPNVYRFLREFLESEKKQKSAEIVRKTKAELRAEQTRREQEEEQRRIREEIERAKRDGSFVPTGRAWYKAPKTDDVMAESTEHREKIRHQAEEIFRQAHNDT